MAVTWNYETGAVNGPISSASHKTAPSPGFGGFAEDGDLMVMWAAGRSTAGTHDWTTPSGWNDWGRISAGPWAAAPTYHWAVRIWWKVLSASEAAPSVYRNADTSNRWMIGTAKWRPSPVKSPTVTAGPQTDTTGTSTTTSYQPPDLVVPNRSLACCITWLPGASGTTSLAEDRGFTLQNQGGNGFVVTVSDRADVSGTVEMPTPSAGFDHAHMSVSFALATPAPAIGWKVGFL